MTVAGARRAAGRVLADRRAERRDEGRGAHHAGLADAGRRAELHDRAGRSGAGARRRADESPRPNQGLFLSRALAIGDRPSFRVDEKACERADAARLRWTRARRARRSRSAERRRRHAAARGARRRRRASCSCPATIAPRRGAQEWRALLPATIGQIVDRTTDAGGTLSSVDYAHPVFELFNAPRSGDFSTARFYRYRALTPLTGASVSARFDDGSPALVERAVGDRQGAGLGVDARSVLDEPAAAAGVSAVRASARQARRSLRRSASVVHRGRGGRSVAARRAHGAVHGGSRRGQLERASAAGAVGRARARDGERRRTIWLHFANRGFTSWADATRRSAVAGRSR